MKNNIVILLAVIVSSFGWGIITATYLYESEPCKTLPDAVTNMFTISGDTLYLKQDVDFTISTRSVTIDSSGTILRHN